MASALVLCNCWRMYALWNRYDRSGNTGKIRVGHPNRAIHLCSVSTMYLNCLIAEICAKVTIRCPAVQANARYNSLAMNQAMAFGNRESAQIGSLIKNLHRVFCVRYSEHRGETRDQIKSILAGVRGIKMVYAMIANHPVTSRRHFLLFRVANKMADMVIALLVDHEKFWPSITKSMVLATEVVRHFEKWFISHLQLVMWSLSETSLPNAADEVDIRNKLMEFLVDETIMPIEK
jgi:hypothetical protein